MADRARTVVVTGGASGIGRAVVAVLRGRGCRVIVIDRCDADVVADLSAERGREAAARGVTEMAPDGIDALVTCAGLGGGDRAGRTISAVNFFGTTHLVERLQPLLARGADPRVVVIASSTSVLPCDEQLLALYLADDEVAACAYTDDVFTAYCTGKRALCHWVRRRSVAPEWAGVGILLNGVAPGTINTPLTHEVLGSPEGRASLVHVTPIALDDFPAPEAIAPLISFLASSACQNMVGQIVYADGGSEVLLRGERIP